MLTKTCCRCGATKPLEAFARSSAAGDGHVSTCRECKATYDAARAHAHREEKRRKGREYHAVKGRAQRLKATYGITPEQWKALREAQGGVCAMCETPLENWDRTIKGARAVVDHDHATTQVRGLLCSPCNTSLGHIEAHIGKALLYLGRRN